jgi:hypothetical protein
MSSGDFEFDNSDRVEDHIIKIPNGYRWCQNCEALTPHEPSSLFDCDCVVCCNCVICGNSGSNLLSCPTCGYEEDAEGSGEQEIQIHGAGCHYHENYADELGEAYPIKLARRFSSHEYYYVSPQFRRLFESNIYQKCNCRKVKIYRKPWVYGQWSRPYDTLDCWNAVEFGYTVRCPICGIIWEEEDTNC